MTLNLRKVDTPPTIQVTVKKCFDEQVKEYEGKQTRSKNCVVVWENEEYYEKFNPKDYDKAVEGKSLILNRKVINGFPYFEKIEIPGERSEAIQAFDKATQPQDVRKDATQERILKGMAFNNACNLIANHPDYREFSPLDLAKQLHEQMYDWLTT